MKDITQIENKPGIGLEKGQSIQFLDYTIQNCLNNDGLVLLKHKPYDHLGNFGTGTPQNVDTCKRYAILNFMIARPEIFAQSIVNKLNRVNSGTMHEYFLLRDALKKENIPMPEEITAGGDSLMIYFNGKPLQPAPEVNNDLKKAVDTMTATFKQIQTLVNYGVNAAN